MAVRKKDIGGAGSIQVTNQDLIPTKLRQESCLVRFRVRASWVCTLRKEKRRQIKVKVCKFWLFLTFVLFFCSLKRFREWNMSFGQ